jgi:hypothetical protein
LFWRRKDYVSTLHPVPPFYHPLRDADNLSSLLDVLAQRKDFGEIRGSILIDGKPQGVSFQRMTGYCEQMDVHEGTATVKEALVFSALLRQPMDVPQEEKLAYVEHIIDLLELRDICDALIGGEYCMISICPGVLWDFSEIAMLTFSQYLGPVSASSSGSA